VGNLDFQKVLSGWITLLYGMFLYGNDAAADVDAYVFGAMHNMLLLLLLLLGLWTLADRLEPCGVLARRCRFLTVTAG
jgi:hypothetical protein